jgi:3-hydroxyacyl-CoA dehydrogenase
LVEVVGGAKTSEATIAQAMRFYAQLGKQAIRLHKEMPGHFANRLQLALYRGVLFLIQEGMIDVAGADDALSAGPGLRWALMGPNQLWHIGGGEGGIRHFMDHFIKPMSMAMDNLGRPTVDAELIDKIIAGVLARAGDRPVAELAREENDALIELLKLRRRAHAAPQSEASSAQSPSGSE